MSSTALSISIESLDGLRMCSCSRSKHHILQTLVGPMSGVSSITPWNGSVQYISVSLRSLTYSMFSIYLTLTKSPNFSLLIFLGWHFDWQRLLAWFWLKPILQTFDGFAVALYHLFVCIDAIVDKFAFILFKHAVLLKGKIWAEKNRGSGVTPWSGGHSGNVSLSSRPHSTWPKMRHRRDYTQSS